MDSDLGKGQWQAYHFTFINASPYRLSIRQCLNAMVEGVGHVGESNA